MKTLTIAAGRVSVVLLLVAGVIMLILALRSPKPAAPPAAATGQPAPSLPVASSSPASPPASPSPTDQPPVDIYALLAQQPKEDKPKS
jgi:hypothetical protein